MTKRWPRSYCVLAKLTRLAYRSMWPVRRSTSSAALLAQRPLQRWLHLVSWNSAGATWRRVASAESPGGHLNNRAQSDPYRMTPSAAGAFDTLMKGDGEADDHFVRGACTFTRSWLRSWQKYSYEVTIVCTQPSADGLDSLGATCLAMSITSCCVGLAPGHQWVTS